MEKATGIASDILLGLILVVIVVLVVRHRRREKEEFEGPSEPREPAACRGTTPPADQAGRPSTERSPARRPATTRANSPAASSPSASVSIQRTAPGSLRSMPKRPKRGS